MEWEPEMEFQGRQQLANALDLSSRLAQKEQTNQQKQQKQSSLFNALCDQRHENRDDNHEPEEDWKQYLVIFSFLCKLTYLWCRVLFSESELGVWSVDKC